MSKAKVRFSGEGSTLSDSVKSLVSTAEQTAGLPRSQGYLLPRNDMRKKAAFTLAEVLITLGIIGVVAALTLPTLISNYQKRVYVTQLKKAYSSLNQGFTLIMGRDGVTELKDTEAFSGISVDNCASDMGNNNFDSNDCKSIREGLQNTFAGITFTNERFNYKYLYGADMSYDGKVINFPDGSYIFHFKFNKKCDSTSLTDGVMKGLMGYFYLDVNGAKNPNIFGRDIFAFYIGNVGGVYPMGSKAVSYIATGGNETNDYWRNTFNQAFSCRIDYYSFGMGCTARVLEEDAMNY